MTMTEAEARELRDHRAARLLYETYLRELPEVGAPWPLLGYVEQRGWMAAVIRARQLFEGEDR